MNEKYKKLSWAEIKPQYPSQRSNVLLSRLVGQLIASQRFQTDLYNPSST